jgi:poly(ribitol-phosphate) beta-N-acetylglucosaminyltransferase
MKVTVVVPVYNAADHLAPCADSVVAQTLDDYEVIFVDDGSDDGTDRLLDDLADREERVRVIHRPPSGGPGGPRNAGIEAATGEYVYFLDDDDWLGPEALERMYAMAVRNDADIVIGRMIGHGRTIPRTMFRESRDRADVLEDALFGMLTPHKLFRRSFLAEHKIRFPEGPVRLEDHRFVLTAYFRAGTISVLADYPCCHWVRRPGSYSRNLPDPAHYYGVLREILDIVDEHVEPGPDRDRYYAHWYRSKVLKRLGEPSYLDAPPQYREAVFDEVRRLMNERFGESVEALLPLRMRVRSALLRAGTRDDLLRLTEAERDVGIEATLDDLRWCGERLRVRFGARFVYAGGTPFAFPGGRWEPPVPLRLPGEMLDAGAEQCQVGLYLRSRADGMDHPLPLTARPTGAFAMSADAVLDPGTLTPGTWDFIARLDAGGWTIERRLTGDVRVDPRGPLTPYRTENGNLSVRVRPVPRPGLRRRARRAVQRLLAG